MMLTKPDCRPSLAFTTTLILSALREGSQRRKACGQEGKPTVTQLFFRCTSGGSRRSGFCQVQHNNPLTGSGTSLINMHVPYSFVIPINKDLFLPGACRPYLSSLSRGSHAVQDSRPTLKANCADKKQSRQRKCPFKEDKVVRLNSPP